MKSATLLPAVLLAVASLHAQQNTPAQSTPPNQGANQSSGVRGMDQQLGLNAKAAEQKALADLERTVSRCPIAMMARQGGGLRVERAQNGSSQPFTMPNLTLTNPKGERIVSATVTAKGYGANKGTTLLQSGSQAVAPPSSDRNPQRQVLSRNVTVKLQPDEDNTVTGEFLLSGFVVLESIELDSVTLADGSAWTFAPSSGCSVQPSPLMLVSGK